MPDNEFDTNVESLARGPTGVMSVAAPTGTEAPAGNNERYDLGSEVGRGGMGVVRVAHDTLVDREVAVKVLRPEHRNASTIARFLREAHIQGRLDHPSIVPVHDLGVDKNGNPYFVMKLLNGITLATVLAKRDRDVAIREKWQRRQLLACFVDVCLAVEFAHQRGVVHRDLKPANIMFGDYGEVYVLDWGLARADDVESHRKSVPIVSISGDGAPGHTAAGSVLGTPGYMSPEQIHDASVDGRADVYALGCILYEILTGEAALPAGVAALDATLAAACHRPSERFPESAIPELDDICAQATVADRAARPKARAVADAVLAYLDGDRDLVRRRELARAHMGRANDAFASAGDLARARAMREAGTALVLDRDNSDAQGMLAALLLEAPDRIPEQAIADADAERGRARRAMLLSMRRGYFYLALVVSAVFLLPIHHPSMIVALIAAIVGAGISTFFASRRELPMRSPIFLAIVAFNTAALAAGCVVFGPFLGMPVFVIAALTGSLIPPLGFRWPIIVIPQLLGFLVPLSLEWGGILPSTYHFDHGLVLTPWVLDLLPHLTGPILFATTFSQILLVTAMMTVQRDAQNAAQNRVHTQTWHLRQLLPRAGSRRGTTGEPVK